MSAKIDIKKILNDHWETLRDDTSGKIFKVDLFVFAGVPTIAAGLLIWSGARLNPASSGVLLAAFAILTGLLFNLLVLLLSLIDREDIGPLDEHAKIKREQKCLVLEQTFANISYSILLGIILSVLCVGGLYQALGHEWAITIMTIFLSFGGVNFALTLLMILKRIHNLVDTKFSS